MNDSAGRSTPRDDSIEDETDARLLARTEAVPIVMISRFPLEEVLAVQPRAPRFTPWCCTRLTRDRLRRFGVGAVGFRNLRVLGRRRIDGALFQELSLGYPRQSHYRPAAAGHYLREVQLEPAREVSVIAPEAEEA